MAASASPKQSVDNLDAASDIEMLDVQPAMVESATVQPADTQTSDIEMASLDTEAHEDDPEAGRNVQSPSPSPEASQYVTQIPKDIFRTFLDRVDINIKNSGIRQERALLWLRHAVHAFHRSEVDDVLMKRVQKLLNKHDFKSLSLGKVAVESMLAAIDSECASRYGFVPATITGGSSHFDLESTMSAFTNKSQSRNSEDIAFRDILLFGLASANQVDGFTVIKSVVSPPSREYKNNMTQLTALVTVAHFIGGRKPNPGLDVYEQEDAEEEQDKESTKDEADEADEADNVEDADDEDDEEEEWEEDDGIEPDPDNICVTNHNYEKLKPAKLKAGYSFQCDLCGYRTNVRADFDHHLHRGALRCDHRIVEVDNESNKWYAGKKRQFSGDLVKIPKGEKPTRPSQGGNCRKYLKAFNALKKAMRG